MATKQKILTLDTKMPMGMYKGWRVADVLQADWTYIRWYVEKVWDGRVDDEVSTVYRIPKETNK